MHNSVIIFGTAILCGLALGYILQSGRFCLNSAFRDIIFIQDLTFFRSYLFALAVAIIGSNLMEDMGWLQVFNSDTGAYETAALSRQLFVPVANVLGGFLFGMGIVLAGGCGSGIIYRIGEGQINAIVATIGFFFGAVMTVGGLLSPINNMLKDERLVMEINGTASPAVWDIFGGGPVAKWATIAVFAVGVLIFVFKGKPQFKAKKGFGWGMTGLLIGLLTILAWWVSAYFGGYPRSMSVTGPLRELFGIVMTKSSKAGVEFDFFGIFSGSWGAFFILSVPFGSWLSARRLKEFKWKVPPANELLTVMLGSFMMGIGAVMAGGCNLGHGVTGMSTMALSSLTAIVSIILGNWFMVYFKMIKPMAELE